MRPIDGTDLHSIARGLTGACGAESAHSGLPMRLATLYGGRSGAASLGAAVGGAAAEPGVDPMRGGDGSLVAGGCEKCVQKKARRPSQQEAGEQEVVTVAVE